MSESQPWPDFGKNEFPMFFLQASVNGVCQYKPDTEEWLAEYLSPECHSYGSILALSTIWLPTRFTLLLLIDKHRTLACPNTDGLFYSEVAGVGCAACSSPRFMSNKMFF